MEVELSKLRNIGIIAHIDAGKTTTTERVLFYTGRIWRMGEVHDGTTVMDHLEEERKRGITIQSAVTACSWDYPKGVKHQINIIDTPGHVDFTAEVERSLRVLDGCVVVFCAVGGVEPQSETVWYQATRYRVPIVAFINKLDRPGADYWKVVKQMRKTFSQKILPIAIPAGAEKDFVGTVDVIEEKMRLYGSEADGSTWTEIDVPEYLKKLCAKTREELLESLSEVNDEILELLVENKPVPVKLIKDALRDAVINKRFVPVVCGSAFKNKGVQFMLDSVCAYLPSPMDVPDTKVYNLETKEYSTIKNSAQGDFMALVFKIVTDRFLGKLAFLRVYSGSFESGKRLYNTSEGRVEKLDRIFAMHADKKDIIKNITAGDIVAVAGLKNSRTGQTLSSKNTNLVFEPPVFPEPVISQAIEPAKPGQLDALFNALSKIVDEDPTFLVRKDEISGETIVSGMGELHLEVNIERIKRDFGVPIRVSTPKVNYKEGITSEVTENGKYVKQTGGHGQYAHVVIKISPNSDEKFVFINSIKGGNIPSQFIPAIEAGVKMGIESGPLAGYPVRNLTVELLDGSFHEVDSSELAFRIGSFETMKKALKKASPILLEPVMDIEIRTPTQYLGDVLGDMSSRRGNTGGLTTEGNLTIIKAFVPLAEMFGYATVIRSLTQGRAGYVMTPKGYERVPTQVAEAVIGKG